MARSRISIVATNASSTPSPRMKKARFWQVSPSE
jgi:hypothetical protein